MAQSDQDKDIVTDALVSDGDLPLPDLSVRLTRMAELHRERQALEPASDESSPADASSKPATSLPATTTRAAGGSISKRIDALDSAMANLEEQGFFAIYPLTPGNEFPTLLTRLPIFRPTRRKRQNKLLNADNALEFETAFGNGKRHGPPLTVRDEDTLIAIIRLRSKRLYGEPAQLPIPIADIGVGEDGKVGVHVVSCTVEQLNKELGLNHSGPNHKLTYASVKRLAATMLELNLKTHERYLGTIEHGRNLPLLHVQWQAYEDDGLLLIMLPPVIANWLDKEYTYVDWNVRRELDDLGKCVHRFLSGQPKRYETKVLRLASAVGYDGPSKNIKPRLARSLDKLLEIGWLTSYRFTGNARTQPLVLHTERA